MTRQIVCRPRTGAGEVGAAGDGLRVLQQQREVGLAPTDTLDQMQHAFERGVGVWAFCRLLNN